MRDTIIHFLTFNAQASHSAVYLALVLIWLSMLAASIMSLRSLDLKTGNKVVWLCLILFLPIGGMAIYSLFCLFRSDWSFMRILSGSGEKNKSA